MIENVNALLLFFGEMVKQENLFLILNDFSVKTQEGHRKISHSVVTSQVKATGEEYRTYIRSNLLLPEDSA